MKAQFALQPAQLFGGGDELGSGELFMVLGYSGQALSPANYSFTDSTQSILFFARDRSKLTDRPY